MTDVRVRIVGGHGSSGIAFALSVHKDKAVRRTFPEPRDSPGLRWARGLHSCGLKPHPGPRRRPDTPERRDHSPLRMLGYITYVVINVNKKRAAARVSDGTQGSSLQIGTVFRTGRADPRGRPGRNWSSS